MILIFALHFLYSEDAWRITLEVLGEAWWSVLGAMRLSPFSPWFILIIFFFSLLVIHFIFLISIFMLFYFTILYWFCHTLTWIHHGCTCVPKYEPPSHLPPHNISLGHPCAPAPSMLYPGALFYEFRLTLNKLPRHDSQMQEMSDRVWYIRWV